MKVLIDHSFKAIRKGEFVEAAPEANEFILDTEDTSIKMSVLKEVATRNKVKISGKKVSESLVELEAGLNQLNIPEHNKMTDTNQIKEIVKNGVEAGRSDEDIIVEIIKAGNSWKVAGKLFAEALQTLGLRISAKDRKDKAFQIMKDADFQPKTAEEVEEMATVISEKIDDTTTEQAVKLIKAFCKDVKVEFPKPLRQPRESFRSGAYEWMKENPDANRDDLVAYCKEQGREEKHAQRLWYDFAFAKEFHKAAMAAKKAARKNAA